MRTASIASWRYPALLFLVAVLIRLTVFAATFDVPGDGPSRALAAYDWAQEPTFPTWGVWPPGFLLLSGCVEALLHDPRVSARLLNVALGSLTVPLSYLLARRLYGRTVAVASAFVLSLVPLHVELSASSLSEPAFVMEIVAATLLLIGGPTDEPVRSRRDRLRVALGVCCLVLASMTRYETWPLLPLFVVHRLVRTRSLRAAGILAIALLAFPAAWTIGNYVHTGDPWFGFTAATSYVDIPQKPVSAFQAIRLLAFWSDSQLGWIVPSAMILGAAVELLRAARGRTNAARLLYLAIVGMQWLVLLRFAMVRGEYVWNRYLIGGLTLGLPLAFVPWSGAAFAGVPDDAPSMLRQRRAAALIAAAMLSLSLSWLGYPEKTAGRWVTSRTPVEIDALVGWLRESDRLGQPILLTPMDWDSTYVALRVPEISKHSLIVSEWIGDVGLRVWIQTFRPTLLVTRAGDELHAARIQAALLDHLDDAPVVFRSGQVRVLDLSAAQARDHPTG